MISPPGDKPCDEMEGLDLILPVEYTNDIKSSFYIHFCELWFMVYSKSIIKI